MEWLIPMRLRRNPKAKQLLLENDIVYRVEKDTTSEMKGKWRSSFARPHQPLFVEIGTGKGQFLAKAAQKHPEINWIGLERVEEPLLQAVRKGSEVAELNQNLRYIWTDAEYLTDVFALEEVDRLYLHFSDPWPKKRHAKRRLTHRRFLAIYKQILSPNGDLILKTDSKSLFEFSLEEFEETNWEVFDLSRDLHHSKYKDNNITTEYEDKFTQKGMPIYYVRVKPVH